MGSSHGGLSVVRKEFLQSEQKVSSAVFVERAREMATFLEDRENVIARSRPAARRSVARLAGVSSTLLHSLRYRPPKQIAADAFARLCAAVESQALAQIRMLEGEISIARACRRGADDRVLCEVETALDKARALIGEAVAMMAL